MEREPTPADLRHQGDVLRERALGEPPGRGGRPLAALRVSEVSDNRSIL